MRFAKAGPRRKHAIVVVGVFVFTVFLLFIQSQRAGWVTKLPTIACIGSESNIVERSEDYVKKFAKKLSKEARNLERANEQLDIAFYGDSILETWRGTDMGRDCRRCDGGPDIFLKYFGSRYKAHVFAVGGDQTAHLQWRLLHGQLLTGNPPKVAVLMIGTNDLGADAACFEFNTTLSLQAVNKAFTRIEGILRFLRTHTPSSKVLLVGLPPRGVWSGGAREFQWPSIFTVPINSLNHILRRLATGDDHVHYVDCGDLLLYNGKIDERMQGDGLHPTPEGLSVLASCILSTVQGIIGPGSLGGGSIDKAHPLGQWIGQKRASGQLWDG